MARSSANSDSSINSSDLESFKHLDEVSSPDYDSNSGSNSDSDSSITSSDLEYFKHLDKAERRFPKRISRAPKKKKPESSCRSALSKKGGNKKGKPSANAVGCVLGSELTEERFKQFPNKYKHLEEMGVCHLPSKDEAYASDYGGPFLCIFTRCIEYGLQFPVRSFIVDLIRFYEISFSQVTPQGWRLLALFAWACYQKNLQPTSELFRYFYLLTKNHGNKGCFYTFSRHALESIPSIFAGGTRLADEKRGWKYEWFFYHFKGEHFEDWPLMNNRWVILETFSGINSLIKLKLTEDEWKFITDVAAKPFEEINVVWKNMLENKENILPLKYCEEVEIPDRSRTVVPFPDAQTKAVLIPDALRGSSSRQTPQDGDNKRKKRKVPLRH